MATVNARTNETGHAITIANGAVGDLKFDGYESNAVKFSEVDWKRYEFSKRTTVKGKTELVPIPNPVLHNMMDTPANLLAHHLLSEGYHLGDKVYLERNGGMWRAHVGGEKYIMRGTKFYEDRSI